MRFRGPLKLALAAFMVISGVAHFAIPDAYAALIPPQLPAPLLLVYVSGIAELALGLALLWPRTRRLAAWGIIALLIAVYPANIYHAASGGLDHPDLPAAFADPVVAWVRLPFQFLFIAWAWLFTRPDEPAS
jgi:uncharacterized membrane protein